MLTKQKKRSLPPFFSIFARTDIPKIASRRTEECFSAPYACRINNDRLRLLPANQPEADACVITTLVPQQDVLFAEWAALLLEVSVSTDIALLEGLVKKHGYILTLAQAEFMVEVTERKLMVPRRRTNDWSIFFFVMNEDSSISVVRFFRYGCRLGRDGHRVLDILHLGNSHSRHAEKYLLVPNLNMPSPAIH